MILLQLNAWTLRLMTSIIDIVNKERPDIVTLQEIPESTTETGPFSSLTEFTRRVHFHYKYFSPVYGIRYMSGGLDFGNAIISNLTLHGQETIFTNLEYKTDYTAGVDDYNVRNFQHVVVEDGNGKKFHLINHHGYHIPEHKQGSDITLRACVQIFQYVQQLEGPVIIAGDFNLEPGSESLAILDSHFRNLSTEFGLTTTRNFLTHKTEVCDYIFVNEHIKVNDFYASEVIASDHQGLVLDFEVIA